MATAASLLSSSSPVVPATPEVNKLSFSSGDARIRAVTVFTKNKAEITRVVTFSSAATIGLHEVELTGLPGPFLIEEQSVAVKGSGYCTILDVAFSDCAEPPPEEDAAEKTEKMRLEEIKERDIQALKDEHVILAHKAARSHQMRQFADRFVERVISMLPVNSDVGATATGAGEGSTGVDGVSKTLEWWLEKAEEADAEMHRANLEGRRVMDAIAKLSQGNGFVFGTVVKETQKSKAKVVINLDVEELGPIELEVKYMIRGATWTPAYDLRLDTQTGSMSCTYYGRVAQSTTEDWEGVDLSLSTAEPTIRGTPPPVITKTVSLKPVKSPKSQTSTNIPRRTQRDMRMSGRPGGFSYAGVDLMGSAKGGGLFGAHAESGASLGGPPPVPGIVQHGVAPPVPPMAREAVARVDGGGGIGAVSFVVAQPAIVRSEGQTKKLTVAVLQLSAEVTHYVVPSQEPAAYLQAKATNTSDYLLLESDTVSIFFDNSFITKTTMQSVSPGESFQIFLGIDPAVKIKVAPPRKTSKKKGILVFGKVDHVTLEHGTSISNKKKVPVTCVVVDAIPRSTDEIIKVTLQQPATASVCDSDAITDEELVSRALELFSPDRGATDIGRSSSSPNIHASPPTTAMQTGVSGVAKSPSNHLAWVVTVAPQGDIQIPLEYTVEWPLGKEVQFNG